MARWINRNRNHTHRKNADGHSLPDSSSNEQSQSQSQSDLQDASSRVDYRDADPALDETPLADLDNFFIPGRDEKGASQAITFHVPPYLARLVNIMVHSKRFPYVGGEDLVRHAVVRHLRWLCGIRETIKPQMVPMLEVILEANRDAEFRIKAEKAFKLIDAKVEYYMRNGEVAEAVRLVGFIMQRVNEVEGSARQREFMKTALMKYAPVMAGVKGWEEAFKELEEK
jgi:hypothetical protein